MIVGAPAAIPLTTPDALTVAIVGLLLVHVPPEGVEDSVVVLPIQTEVTPLIAVGNPFTVAVVVAKQPLGSV